MAADAGEVVAPTGTAHFMKRAHRRWHRLIWLIAAPAIIAVLGVAVGERSAQPVGSALPAALLPDAVSEGG